MTENTTTIDNNNSCCRCDRCLDGNSPNVNSRRRRRSKRRTIATTATTTTTTRTSRFNLRWIRLLSAVTAVATTWKLHPHHSNIFVVDSFTPAVHVLVPNRRRCHHHRHHLGLFDDHRPGVGVGVGLVDAFSRKYSSPFVGCCPSPRVTSTTTLARRQRDYYDYDDDYEEEEVVEQARPVRETSTFSFFNNNDGDYEYDEYDYQYNDRNQAAAASLDRRVRRRVSVSAPTTANWWTDDDLEEEDDFGDDDEEEEPSSGNFWINPKEGLDVDIREDISTSRSSKTRQQGLGRRNRDDLPPSTAPPHQRQSTTRGRRQERRSPQTTTTQPLKTTFRSGTPPPPAPVLDLYNRLFWYGFDPADTTSPADPTMFGGTKGKFNGLAYLKDGVGVIPAEELTRKSRRNGRNMRMDSSDSYWEEVDEVVDDEEVDLMYDSYDEDDNIMDDNYDFDRETRLPRSRIPQPPPQQQQQELNLQTEESFVRRAPVTPPYDPPQPMRSAPTPVTARPYPQSRRRAPPPRTTTRSNNPSRNNDNGDWVSKQVSSWFRPGEELEDEEDDYDDDDSGDEEESLFAYKTRGRKRRQKERQSRQSSSSSASSWSLFDAVEKFLGLDRIEMDSRAEEYDRQMGIGRRRPQRPLDDDSRSSSSSQREGASRPPPRRRKGYAYRYQDDDGTPPVVDFEVVEEKDVPLKEPTASTKATVLPEDSESKKAEMPWEERAFSVERVPPAGIPAWGPTGDLGMDARTKAILDAMEDIHLAKEQVDEKKKEVEKAKEEIAILRVDAELEKKRLRNSMQEARVIQAKLREIDVEVQDASRALRYAQQRLKISQDELAALERRHWAVLSFYNPKQVENAVTEAIREFEDSEPAARLYREKTESMDKTTQVPSSNSIGTMNE